MNSRQTQKLSSLVMCLFGLSVIASGLWRFVSAEGGHNGLWFGIVMGGLALISSCLFYAQQNVFANTLAWLCIVLVGGWFCYEALVKKGLSNAEPRQLIIIGITVVTAAFLVINASILVRNRPKSNRPAD